jgi:hypothetical protein
MDFTEPTWGTSENRDSLTTTSVFNELIPSGTAIAALVVRWLQYHFISADHMTNELLYPLLWNSDDNLTKIFIGISYAKNDPNASKKPGLYVTREKTSDDQIYMNPDTAIIYTGSTPPETYTYHKLISGNIVIRCESNRAGGEAEALGEEVFKSLIPFTAVMREDTGLLKMDVREHSSTTKLENGNFVCNVIVTWTANVFYQIPEETAW